MSTRRPPKTVRAAGVAALRRLRPVRRARRTITRFPPTAGYVLICVGTGGRSRRRRTAVERAYATELLARSAAGVGYLLKDRVGRAEEFLQALQRVADGGTAMDPEVVSQLMARRAGADPLSSLTPREREVLALTAEGRNNGTITELLFITESSVNKHIGNIFSKLGMPTPESGNRRVLAVLAYLPAT